VRVRSPDDRFANDAHAHAGPGVTRTRKRIFTRAHGVAWLISLALGVGWVVLLGALPDDLDSVVMLLLGLVGIFGFLFGLLMATGLLVRVFRMLGNPTRAVSSSPAELPADVVSGVWVMLFCVPSSLVYVLGPLFTAGS
jgi:hypothetical protein